MGCQDCCDASDEGPVDPRGCREELRTVAERIAELLVLEQRGQALKQQMLEPKGGGRWWDHSQIVVG